MALGPLHLCRCGQLSRAARCSGCQAKRDAEVRERRRQTSALRPWQSLYVLPEWKLLQARVRAEEPRCRRCGVPANVADHIQPHRGDLGLFLERSNLQVLCPACHGKKTAAEDGGFGNPTRRPRT